ncbi:unnamed protein product [Schistosoma rodhaini]|uniref:RING-type domain-containing protein n=1 Tax=Schistosoma rodhaini TaxID=6188 RepID=A0A183RLZ7_9TREM|nr:unnamed protein product [Schistosoma rodhaini]CAH8682126.1 unnamed protein product [Schistosoma rodhaini]
MQSNPAFSEETKIVLSSINAPSLLVNEENQSVENSNDAFELLLPVVLNKETLDIVEANLGLGGGGDWWIDPSRNPIEVDSNGNRDEGAILDVEASCKIWYRTPFDRDPEFCNNSYHLLNRLNELAKIKGLIEEASLRKHSPNEVGLNDSDRQIYHSTLSVNGSMDFKNFLSHPNRDIQNIDPQLDLRRSLNSSAGEYANLHGTYALRKQNNSGKLPLREVFDARTQEVDSAMYCEKPKPPFSQAVYSGLPQLHRSQRPATPNNVSPNISNRKISSKPNDSLLVPGATSSPYQKASGQKHSVLSRTYSKEQMDLLKEANDYPLNESILKVPALLSRSHALTTSLPMSDNEGDIDVTRSLDISSGVNQLSQSLSATELVMKGRKLSEKFNASYSSMRSSDVFELARLQETHLREHSGSRSKLDCSNTSLTESSFGDEKHRKHKSSAAGSIGQKSGSGLSSCGVSATHSHEEIAIEDTNGRPERQHTIIAKECFKPLSSSVDCEPKVNMIADMHSSTNLDQADVVTSPSKPLNSTYDAPDFKYVYDCDSTSQADELKNLRPIIDSIDSTVITINDCATQGSNSVAHISHPNDEMMKPKENEHQPDAYELNGHVTALENNSDTALPMKHDEDTKSGKNNVSQSEPGFEQNIPHLPDSASNVKNLQSPQATRTITKPVNNNKTIPNRQSGLKIPSKTSIPVPNGSISRLPMLSQKMPSMSISSRLGSRKTSITGPEQGSSFDRPINKTQPPSHRNNPSSNNSSVSNVSSSNIKTNQTSNSTKSLPKSSVSLTVQQNQRPVPSRISLSSGTSGTTGTIRKPIVPSFGSSRGKSSGRS